MGKNKKILVVDDYDVNLILIEQMLIKKPYKLLFADNGKKAIQKLTENPDIDIILMDIKMQGLTGVKTTKLIRQTNKKVTIIAQTAYAMNYEKEIILKSGFDDYITKPIIKSKLIELIEKY